MAGTATSARTFISGEMRTRRCLLFFMIYVIGTICMEALLITDLLPVFWGGAQPTLVGDEGEIVDWQLFAFLGVAGIVIICYLISGFYFLTWNYRVVANLDTFGLSSTGKITPRWAIIWWFIPIVNLFMAYKSIGNAWRGSQQNVSDAGVDKKWPALGNFWGAWITLNVLGTFGSRMHDDLADTGLVTANGAMVYIAFALIGLGLQIWVYFLVRTIMTEIDDLQTRRSQTGAFA